MGQMKWTRIVLLKIIAIGVKTVTHGRDTELNFPETKGGRIFKWMN